MHAFLSGLRLPTAGFPIAPRSRKEFADVSLYFSSKRDMLQFSVSSIRSEGTRRGRPRRSRSSSRPIKEGSTLDPRESDGEASKSSSQEEIIALFKRIQSSISKESTVSKKGSSKRKKDRKPTESVLEDLRWHPPQKHVTDKSSLPENVLPIEKVKPAKGERNSDAAPDDVPIKKVKPDKKETDSDASPQARLPRPASNFVKRSPVRSMASTKGENVPEVESRDVVRGAVPATESEPLELQEIHKLKLPELKELAKSQGVKGFSKLKKAELVELLKGMTRPS